MPLTGVLGWLFGKDMIETEGFLWPWLLHLVSDVPVLTFTAIAALAARGH